MKTQSQEIARKKQKKKKKKKTFYASWTPPFQHENMFLSFYAFLLPNQKQWEKKAQHSRRRKRNVKRSIMFHRWDENYIIYILATQFSVTFASPYTQVRVLIDDGYGQRIELRKQNVFPKKKKKKSFLFCCVIFTRT